MKKIIVSLLVLVISLFFVACSTVNETENSYDDYSITTTENTTVNKSSYVDSNGIIQNSELAKSCQKILGSGADKNGDIYEIVADVRETYQGSQLMVGVIKNSQWLIELTADNPYINDGLWDKSGADIDKIRCDYLSNGTFYEETTIYSSDGDNFSNGKLNLWNVESNKTLYLKDLMLGNGTIYPCTKLNSNDMLVLIKSEGSGVVHKNTLMFLDTKNLSTTELYTVEDTEPYYDYDQISDGLFYVPLDFPNKTRIGTFYNENGDKVFDLSEYDTDETDVVYVGNFQNGECEIHNELTNGTQFKIIIDKKGKMLSQKKIEN